MLGLIGGWIGLAFQPILGQIPDLNPLDWLTYAVQHILDQIGTLISNVLYGAVIGPIRQQLFDSVTGGGPTLGIDTSKEEGIFNVLAGTAMAVVTVAVMFRFARGIWKREGRGPLQYGLLDILPRFLIAGFFLIPVNEHTAAFNVINYAITLSGEIGAGIIGPFVNNLTPPGTAGTWGCSGSTTGDQACNLVASYINSLGQHHGILEAIAIVLIVIFLLYFLALLIFRLVALVFLIAVAPLTLGMAVYDPRNKFTSLWVQTFISALVLPLMLGIGLGVTLSIVVTLMGTNPTDFALLTSVVFLILGMGFTTKLVTQFASHHMGTHTVKSLAGKVAAYSGAGMVVGAVSRGVGAVKGAQQEDVASKYGLPEEGGTLKQRMTRAASGSLVGGYLANKYADKKGINVGRDKAVDDYLLAAHSDFSSPMGREAQEYAQAKGLDTSNQLAVASAYLEDSANQEVVAMKRSRAVQVGGFQEGSNIFTASPAAMTGEVGGWANKHEAVLSQFRASRAANEAELRRRSAGEERVQNMLIPRQPESKV